MVDISTASELLVAFSVVFGVITWYMQNKEMKEIHQTRLFMQIWQQYNSVEYAMQRYKVYEMSWESLEDYERKYMYVPAEEKEPMASEVSMGRTFEGLSMLLQRKLIDTEWLYQLYGGDIIKWWEKFQPLTEEYITSGYAHGWPLVEPLYEKMKNIREQRRPGKTIGITTSESST
jgi:hypothetical protein